MTIVKVSPAKVQQGYGTALRADKYTLYAILKSNPTKMVSLAGHETAAASYTDDTPDPGTRIEWRNGRWTVKNIVTAKTEIQSLTFDVTYPEVQWSPMDDIAKFGTDCFIFAAVPECPPNSCESHGFIYDETSVAQPRRTGAAVGFGENGAVVDKIATVSAVGEIHQLNPNKQTVVDFGSDLMVAIAVGNEFCQGDNCDGRVVSNGVLGGGTAGVGDTVTRVTDDAFVSTVATGAAAHTSDIVIDLYKDGDFIIAIVGDAAYLPTVAASIRYSLDNGATWVTAVSGLYTRLSPITGGFMAVGDSGLVATSPNGRTWTVLTSTEVAATSDLYDIAFDESNGNVYLVGVDTGAGIAYRFDGSVNGGIATDITADLAAVLAVPALLSTAAVLWDGHIAIGSNTGILYENFDTNASGGGTWTANNFGVSARTMVAGNVFMSKASVGSAVYARDFMTAMDWVVQSVDTSGTINDWAVRKADDGTILSFHYVTSDGELNSLRPCTPSLADILAS